MYCSPRATTHDIKGNYIGTRTRLAQRLLCAFSLFPATESPVSDTSRKHNHHFHHRLSRPIIPAHTDNQRNPPPYNPLLSGFDTSQYRHLCSPSNTKPSIDEQRYLSKMTQSPCILLRRRVSPLPTTVTFLMNTRKRGK
ncbi:hypothetical protein HAX54_036380 [Datura stramonium]|uniref:Uncharacterized protein n=1 Tax=Datura stramonium TaxID=4076 RepID=A0ABS8SH05_DATST|nr:hypothetical protein [Datura stramonium]